jgi:hypothetical protein
VTTELDLGEEGLGPGDMFLVTDVPMNSEGRRIGTMEGIETILAAAHDGTVSQELTLRLTGGEVMVEGVVRHDDAPYELAVVGGTERYLKARGQLEYLGDDEQAKVSRLRLTVTN